MYTQLAPNQASALTQGCPKCGASTQQLAGRTGPTVVCANGHKVNRPRGRSFTLQQKDDSNTASERSAQRQLEAAQRAGDYAQQGAPSNGNGAGEQQAQGPQGPPEHPQASEIWRRIQAGFRTLLLVGPSGSGKTTLFYQVAARLAFLEGHAVSPRLLSFTAGLTEGKLIGFSDIHGHYVPGYFVAPYEQGGVFGADEFDAADANVVLSLNAAVENGHLSVPSRVDTPTAERHAHFCFIGMANTFGWGADIRYVGRNQLDASTLSRFAGAVVKVDYDKALETRLTAGQAGFREAFWGWRSNVERHKLRRVWGTRELLAGVRLLDAGYAGKDVFSILTSGWTEDEVHKLNGGA